MVAAAAADVEIAAITTTKDAESTITATATATATATSTTTLLENANSRSVEFAALTVASANGSEAATSNLNNNSNNNCSIHIDNSNLSNNNNNMSDLSDAIGTTTTTTTTETATTTTTTAAATSVATTVAAVPSKSAVSQRNVDIKIEQSSNMEAATQQLTKKVLKLDLGGKNLDEYSLKSPKSPIAARLPHQTSLTSSVDVEDRKTLREALYQGIFHRHRRTIFAVGSFLRMLRSRNSQYNTIRSSSEGEDIDEVR
ncbi:hypothetical protein ACLKA7_006019 [Drosophila subpalustris]